MVKNTFHYILYWNFSILIILIFSGVYLANETYAEMTLKIEEQDKEIQEQILHIKAMKEEKDRIESLFTENSNRLNLVENELDITNQTLNQTKTVLKDKKQVCLCLFSIYSISNILLTLYI